MEVERKLGFEPTDREFEKLGYDIESRVPDTGKLRFIEVKGRVSGAATITVTRNEILYSLNKPEDFILGIVEFVDGIDHRVHYVRQPFQREPDFGVTSVNYDFAELLARAGKPSERKEQRNAPSERRAGDIIASGVMQRRLRSALRIFNDASITNSHCQVPSKSLTRSMP